MTEFTIAADGTKIAYDKSGDGPALVIVGGAFNTRHSPGELVPLLAGNFAVYTWDRRGRGDSGDTAPYAIQREIEDLAAVIEAAGEPARVYGHSSGAILGLEAAMHGVSMVKLALYEPPYVPVPPDGDPMAGVQPALDADDPELAAITFVKGTGAENTDGLEQTPWWPAMVAIAHTLPYDLALAGDGTIPLARLASVTVPTLVMDGGDSPGWASAAAVAISGAIQNATRTTIAGQAHGVAPEVLARVLLEFFG